MLIIIKASMILIVYSLNKIKILTKGYFLSKIARILLFKVYWRLQLVKTVASNGCVFLLTSLVYFLELFFSLLQIVVEYSLLPFLTDNFTWKIMDKRKLVTIIKWPFSKCKPDSLWIPAFSLYWYILKNVQHWSSQISYINML